MIYYKHKDHLNYYKFEGEWLWVRKIPLVNGNPTEWRKHSAGMWTHKKMISSRTIKVLTEEDMVLEMI